MYGKGQRVGHRRGALKRNGGKPSKEGELLTMDWIILKSEKSRGADGETVLHLLLDVGTDFLLANPSVKRSAEAAYNGILLLYGTRCKVKYCRMDDAKELKKSCKMHRIPFETSAPYIHETNGLIEAYNRIELYGGRVCLEQCGAPRSMWPYAFKHYAFSRNIYPTGDNPKSPYERKFLEGPFPGLRVPFLARVMFIQLPPIAKSTDTHRADSVYVPGVFLGWSAAPGGKWTGRYFCAALTEFVGMDLRVGGHVREQEVLDVIFDENEVVFPLKNMYDRANRTLEGLSAPYGCG